MSQPQPNAPGGRAERLLDCVDRILRSEGVPPFREHANEIVARTVGMQGNCSQLARVVLKDLGLSSQILKLSNSAGFNRSERNVNSVAHAIALLGWEKVRSLAGSLKYVEHFSAQSPVLGELMAASLLSAYHGREIAATLQYPRPEEAYVGALFRSLGEVLIACHYPREYSEILLVMQDEKVPEPTACVRVMGFAWDDVGVRVAQAWKLPAKVTMCLRGAPSHESAKLPAGLDLCLASIADYSHSLTHALYREGRPVDAVKLAPVLDPLGRKAIVPVRELRKAVETARVDTESTLAVLRIPRTALQLADQAERARGMLGPRRVFDLKALRLVEAAVQAANRSVVRGDFEVAELVNGLLEQLASAGFDRVVFGLVNEDRTEIAGRLGFGRGIDEVLPRFRFSLEQDAGPLLALKRRSDVAADRSADGRYDDSSLVRALEPAAFVLLPVVVDREAIGCLYADVRQATAGLDKTRAGCARVRDVVAQAIRRKAARRA